MKRQQSTVQLHLSSDRRWGQMQLPVGLLGGELGFSSLGNSGELNRCESAISWAISLNNDSASQRRDSKQEYTAITPIDYLEKNSLEAGDRAWSLSR